MNSKNSLATQLQLLPKNKLAEIAPLIMAQARERAKDDFEWFVFHIFSASFPKFVQGQYLKDVCKHLTENDYTMDVTGRNHFKSTRLYADVMWRLLHEADTGWEGWYFSYKQELAAYHLGKIKELIRDNPFYYGIIDNKPTAETVLSYSWEDNGPKMTVRPAGLLAFKRGIHCDHVYIDDPLQDPSNELQPTQIYKINNTIKQSILPMVNRGGTCRIVGTPQTPEDFYFDTNMQEKFKFWITPAIVDEVEGKSLWPEWITYDELVDIRRTQGTKIFNPEYMATPVYTENAYISPEVIIPLSTEKCWTFTHHEKELEDKIVVAGFDIGKKSHPSHLTIFIKHYYRKGGTHPFPQTHPLFKADTQKTHPYALQILEQTHPNALDPDREYITEEDEDAVAYYQQIYSFWMDQWDYSKQVEYLNLAIEFFNISKLRFDNTRGEFEFAIEQKLLSRRAEPVVLTAKKEASLAANFGSLVEQSRVAFINESRMRNQITAVNNSLKAIESKEGHGDAFWSTAMALYDEALRIPRIRAI